MKKDLLRKIKIPEDFIVNVKGNEVTISLKDKKVTKRFDLHHVELKKEGENIILSSKKATRRESKMLGTAWAHIKNMIKGLEEDFVYKLEICNVHFPMNVKVEGNNITIKSFLGEAKPRNSKIVPGVKVDIKGSEVKVSSHDIEAAGQTAANLEKATRLTGRDRRIFQDGIFIKEKPGRLI